MGNKLRIILLFTAFLSTAQLVTPGASGVRATPFAGYKGAQLNTATDALDAWNTPQVVSTKSGYQNYGSIAASPIDGSADVAWAFADGGTGAQIILSGNSSLGGAFGDYTLANGQVDLLSGTAAAHDSQGRTHVLYWKWPPSDVLCDYYALVDANHNVLVNQQIPGSCDAFTPRKLLAIAVDSNLTVHIAMGRDQSPGSLLYWQRTNGGTWTAQRELIPNQCAPTDPAIAVSTGGTVMVAWKDCAPGTGSDIYTAVRNSPGSWTVEDISASCCAPCPSQSSAYLPDLYPAPDGGIRATWADGRCGTNETDIYYREWVSGSGWNSKPLVRVVNNSGKSYQPTIAVDDSGEAHIVWSDDTGSAPDFNRMFYSHGRGSTFTAPEIPFQAWAGNAWQRDPSLDFAFNNLHLSFASVKLNPTKNNFYSYQQAIQPPPCPGERFKDVCPNDYYYWPVIHLNDAGVIDGYRISPPCPNGLWVPCFLPGNNATRGQISKIIVLASGMPINTTGGPHFSDVPGPPNAHTFYDYIETLANAGVIIGYNDGTFRPGNNVTRGQISKMIVLGANMPINTSGGPHFSDVPGPPNAHTFYDYIETLANAGVIIGYNDGTFRPGNNVTRGQLSKMTALAFGYND